MSSFFNHHGVSFFELSLLALRRDASMTAAEPPDRSPQFSQVDLLMGDLPAADGDSDVEGVLLIPDDLGRAWASTNWRRWATPTELDALVQHGALARDLRELVDAEGWGLEVEGASRLDLAKALAAAPGREHEWWPLVKESSLEQQVDWLASHNKWIASGAPFVPFTIERVPYGGDTRDDPYAWTQAVQDWVRRRATGAGARLVVNLHGTPTMNQLAWYYLAWSDSALRRATFIKCDTPRTKPPHRPYRDLQVSRARKSLLQDLATNTAESSSSPEQRHAEGWLELYKEFDDLFVILVLGERGTGKSRSVARVFGCETVNCGEFGGDLNMARSRLFGHVRGAFTGAHSDEQGAFGGAAESGALFLDEIHLLTPAMQGALLTALSTPSGGEYTFTPVGGKPSNPVKFQLIVGSNLPESQLRRRLLPDFFDRICQRRVSFPPLPEDREGLRRVWDVVWEGMEFRDLVNPAAHDVLGSSFMDWLWSRPLHGNYRDLQRVAVMVADVLRAEMRGRLPDDDGRTWLARVQGDWTPGLPPQSADSLDEQPDASARVVDDDHEPPIDPALLADPERFIAEQQKRFAEQLISRYDGNARAAARSLGDRLSYSTLRRWRDGRV